MQDGRKGRLHPSVGFGRNEVADCLNALLGAGTVAASGKKAPQPASDQEKPLVLVACSGGPDSLALAALAAHFARRGSLAVGAVVVDHQLQDGSAAVARRAAQQCEELGIWPVLVKKVRVESTQEGPEMAARTARYGAFEQVVRETGASAVLLAHTLDDQAETVLLGLARGSGTRSLSGMPPQRVHAGVTYLRPLLNMRREQILEICQAENLDPWEDPTNQDQSMMRSKVRHTILPFLEEELGGGVAVSLARTAAIIGPDAEYLQEQATKSLPEVLLTLEEMGGEKALDLSEPLQQSSTVTILNRAALNQLHPALHQRVLSQAVKETGGETPGFERLSALARFAQEHAKAGPVQLAGHVSAYRRRPPVRIQRQGQEFNLKDTGIIVFINNK